MNKILMKGNEIIAEAALQAGCRLFFGYPITPSTEIVEYLSRKMPEYGGTVLQAEDEIGAINMCYGAACTGEKVMTASSSPGISLKQEGISYCAANQLPVVIVNITRSGPGLGGLGATQSDYFQAVKGGGHGDYRVIVLAPSKAQELYDYTLDAFELAMKHRNPVLILADGFLGQTMEPVNIYERRDIGTQYAKDWIINGSKGRKKRTIVNYSLVNEKAENDNIFWENKYKEIAKVEQKWEEFEVQDAEYLLVSYGTTARICKSAVKIARDRGIKLGLIRPITLWPFPSDAFSNLKNTVKGAVSVELNSGQMIEDVKLALECKVPVMLCRRMGGMMPSEEEIADFVERKLLRIGGASNE